MTASTPSAPHRVTSAETSAVPKGNRASLSLGLAIAGLFFALSVPIPVWGLFMLFLAAPLAIAALISGHAALTASRPGASGRGRAITALVLAYASLAICFFTTLFWVITMAVPR